MISTSQHLSVIWVRPLVGLRTMALADCSFIWHFPSIHPVYRNAPVYKQINPLAVPTITICRTGATVTCSTKPLRAWLYVQGWGCSTYWSMNMVTSTGLEVVWRTRQLWWNHATQHCQSTHHTRHSNALDSNSNHISTPRILSTVSYDRNKVLCNGGKYSKAMNSPTSLRWV